MDIQEFANRFFDAENTAFLDGRFEGIDALEDPNVVYHMPFGDIVGSEAHHRDILLARQRMTGLKPEWTYITGEGNLFVASYKRSFVLTNENPDRPETVGKKGKRGTTDTLVVFRLEKRIFGKL